MRKLLVASQQSGVGKTTTSINLAAATAMAGANVLLLETDPLSGVSTMLKLSDHPDRRPLSSSGIDLPGTLCCGVIPNLDVVSPYEEGGCSDDHLEQVLQLIGARAFEDHYDCLIINAPPFLGGRPVQLLAMCEEYLIVMQPESLAQRTLPAFTELIHRSAQQAGVKVQMRGLLLVLPESEVPGGRCERELRGRFGTRILRPVIPYDEEVVRAQLFGHVLVHASPDSPAALEYRELASILHLASGVAAGRRGRSAEDLLVLAAPAVQPLTPEPVVVPKRRSTASVVRVTAPPPPPVEEEEPEQVTALPAFVPSGSRSGATRVPRPTPPPAPPDSQPLATSPPAPVPPVTIPPAPARQLQWLLVAGAAAAVGSGLRFVPSSVFTSQWAVPLAVGVATTASVGLGLWLLAQHNLNKNDPPPTEPRI